jgi:hypothetical protein
MSVVQLTYPFDDIRAGMPVLATAIRFAGPEDGLQLFVVPAGDVAPSDAQIEQFRKLCWELALPYGPVPAIRVLPAADVPDDVLVRIQVTGDPVTDADAVLMLGSVARHFGSDSRDDDLHLMRGDARLLRLEHHLAALRRAAHPAARAETKVRVAVLVQRVQVWGAVETIVAAARERDDVDLEVVLLDERERSYRQHRRADFEKLLADRGVVVRDEAWLGAHQGQIDVVVTPDPYMNRNNTTRGLSPRELADAGIRVVLCPYAQALGGTPLNLGLLHDLPFHSMAWRIYAPSLGAAANFAAHCAAGEGHVRSLGSPKREHLLTDPAVADAGAALRRKLGTATVTLWNPHTYGDGEMATFVRVVKPMLDWFEKHRGSGLVVRPHPRLFADFERTGHGDLVKQVRRLIDRLPHVLIDESIDAAPALLAADALVSDLSSLIPEYAVLGRPIALLRETPYLRINDDRACLDEAVMVDDEAGLRAFLRGVAPAVQGLDGANRDDLGAGARILESILTDFRAETTAVRQ